MEIWKDIEGYEGLYKISNFGRIKSLPRNTTIKKEKILKQLKRNGYLYVKLCNNGDIKSFSVHRLVALSFLKNPNNFDYVNHKDENKYNNKVENLEWCSQKYNINYGSRNIRVAKKLSTPICQYDLEGNFIKKWDSIQEAIREYNNYHISSCLKYKRKTACGFIWKYCKSN